MAYNNYFPQYYQPVPQMPTQVQTQQTNNGFVSVPSELDARNYPVGYGNSVMFKDEKAPYIYTKTMGFSQLEPPRFEKYKLVKEEANDPVPVPAEPVKDYAPDIESLKSEIESMKAEIEDMSDTIASLKKRISSSSAKKVNE